MASRELKQLIYGSFYLVLATIILYGLYFLLVRPTPSCFDGRKNQGEEEVDCGGPCQSCEIKRLAPISLLSAPQVLTAGNQTSIFFKLKNPNANYGAEFTYQIDLYDPLGVLIISKKNSSYIYASQIKSFAEVALDVDPRRVTRVEISVSDIIWRPKEDFSDPALSSRGIKAVVEKNQVRLTGLAVNRNSYGVARVGVLAVFYDAFGLRVAVSKTVLNDLKPFEERAFTIIAQLPDGSIDPQRTEVFIEARR